VIWGENAIRKIKLNAKKCCSSGLEEADEAGGSSAFPLSLQTNYIKDPEGVSHVWMRRNNVHIN